MKEFYAFFLRALLCLAVFHTALPGSEARAQYYSKRTITDPSSASGAYTGGYYEFLPPGYDPNGTRLYPIMIFNHGSGEFGDGSTAQLARVLTNGPPKLINNGTFPTSFTVNGKTFTFIVIAPQFSTEGFGPDEAAVVDYMLSHYKADPNRLYLTGLSAGGTPVWYYPALSSATCLKVAALVPVAGHGIMDLSDALQVASNHLPVYATQNANDPTVMTSYTTTNVDEINSYPGVDPRAVDTIFDDASHSGTHDAWTTTYDPNFRNPAVGNLNVYEWMLQYSRGAAAPLPVTMTDYTATLSADGTEVNVDWTTTVEQNNKYFILQRSSDGKSFSSLDTIAPAASSGEGHSYAYTDQAPLKGNNFYRLTQVDLDGKATGFGVLKVTVGATGSSFTLKLSPNPTSNTLYLEGTRGGQGGLEIDLSDLQGKVLKTWNVQQQGAIWNKSIDVSNLPRGNYFIRVRGTGIRWVQQFSKL
jgi:dienelactone hydrolase